MMETKLGEIGLQEGERVDDTGFGGLKLIQKPEEFCYGVDAVLLADFAARQVKRQAGLAVDLGTGTGIVPLILSHKTQIPRLIGVEVQNGSYGRAVRNGKLNRLEDRVRFIQGDIAEFKEGWAADLMGTADLVTSNPPYTAGQCGLTSANVAKHIARHETTADLECFIRCAAFLLKEKGELFLVHRPSRIVDICCYGRQYGLEVKTLRFVSPYRDGEPNILLIHLMKGGGRQVRVLPNLSVYEKDGSYTEALREAYR